MKLPKGILVTALLLALASPAYARDKQTRAEKQLDKDRAASNGILVGQPKVYDDSILQQMLSAAEARLATLQLLDQTGIASRLGSLTGATQTVNSFGISVQGPPIPQMVTTANGPTNTSVAGTQNSSTQGTAPTGPTSSTTSQSSTQNTTTAPVTNVVTTNPQITPPAVTAPAPTTSLPSSFSVSASDILNEQMQLTYEIANLRLLLEGSLNDRLINDPDKDLHMVKPRVTLGFPITLMPDARHKNAIAIVEVEIDKVECPRKSEQQQGQQESKPQQEAGQTSQEITQQPAHQQTANEEDKSEEEIKKQATEQTARQKGTQPCDDLEPDDPPAIVALLPREKTYNVAALTDSSISIGAGVVTQVVGISGSFLHARKTYYYVQDQDTVALTFQPAKKNAVGFLWEFRPVLGASLLREGLKQTFVQLSFPSDWSAKSFGSVHIRTYWRDYDAGKNLVKGIRPKSLVEAQPPYPTIANYPMQQQPSVFSKTSLEDLGNGQMLVNLYGRFLGGTYVRVGSTILGDGTAGFSSEYNRIRFVAPIADLASKTVVLVARDGTIWPIQLPNVNNQVKNRELLIKSYTLKTLDDSNTQLSLKMAVVTNNPPPQPQTEAQSILSLHKTLPLVFLIGGKVFGYSDAPLRQKDDELTAVVPTSLLAANPVVAVRSLFTTDRYWRNAQIPIKEFAGGGVVPKIAVLEAGTDSARYLLYGVKFGDKPNLLSPAGGSLQPFGDPAIPDMKTITLSKDQVKSQKQVVIESADGFVYQISVPNVDLPDATKSTIKSVQPVTVGSSEAAFKGSDFSTLQKVVFNSVELPLRKQTDGKVIWLSGLKAAGVTAEVKKQTLDFYFKSGKQSIPIDVVAGP